MIKCGHCGKRHATVQDVRECLYDRERERIEAEQEIYADNAYVRMMENTGIGTDPRDLFDDYAIPW